MFISERLVYRCGMRYCECGCGGRLVERYKDGHRSKARFINGHNSRGEGNPMFGVHLVPWNKGREGLKGEKNGMFGRKNELSPNWKGDNVTNRALHQWVRNNKTKSLCEECLTNQPYDIANVSPKYNSETYNRDLNNWRWLCRGCHQSTDRRSRGKIPWNKGNKRFSLEEKRERQKLYMRKWRRIKSL